MDVGVRELKAKLSATDRDSAWGRIRFATELPAHADRDLIIEAVVEDPEAKVRMYLARQ